MTVLGLFVVRKACVFPTSPWLVRAGVLTDWSPIQNRNIVDRVVWARHRDIEVRQDAQSAYNASIQRGSRKSVWEIGGCSSWYRDKFGRITTMWPGFTFRFRQQTRTFDLNAYHAVRAHDLSAGTEKYVASA